MRRLLLLMIVLFPLALTAQKRPKGKSKRNKADTTVSNSLNDRPSLVFEKEEKEEIEAAPLKKKKNEFFGELTRRFYTNNVVRGARIIEDFYLLRAGHLPDQYVQEIYIYDAQRKRVRAVKPNGQTTSNLLHGPYKKLRDDIVVEEGMYFYGVKHLRWLSLNSKEILLNKEHFHKGWYRDSEISYYDADAKTKVREVIPVQYEKREGTYYYFYENGRVAVKGQYMFGKKVGIWEEYYNAGRVIAKREIQYPPDPFQKNFKPFIRREWNERGQETYRSSKIRRG